MNPRWKISKMVLLEITGFGFVSDNIRLIAFTPILLKFIKKILHVRLSKLTSVTHLLQPCQIEFNREFSIPFARIEPKKEENSSLLCFIVHNAYNIKCRVSFFELVTLQKDVFQSSHWIRYLPSLRRSHLQFCYIGTLHAAKPAGSSLSTTCARMPLLRPKVRAHLPTTDNGQAT